VPTSNKELLLSAYRLRGSELAFAGVRKAAAAEFRSVRPTLNRRLRHGVQMIQCTSADPTDAMLSFVREWFDLLAQGRFEEASVRLDEPNSYGVVWSADRLRMAAEEAFGPGSTFRARHPDGPRYSQPSEAAGSNPAEVTLMDEGRYALDHDVPLNGEWSDLTARFFFLRRPDGYAVVLHDMHVL